MSSHPGLVRVPHPQNASRLRNQNKWDISKIVLESLCTVFSIALLALLLKTSMATSPRIYFRGLTVRSYSLAIAAVIIFWEIIVFISMCVRRRKSGFHPGVHVGVELILWLACLICVVVSGIGFVNSVSKTSIAVVVLLAILLVLHFTLFVRSCVEVDRRRKLKYAQMMNGAAAPVQQLGQQYGQAHEQVAEAPNSFKEGTTKTEDHRNVTSVAVPELPTARDPMHPVEAYADPVYRYEMAANEPWMNHEPK